MKIIRKVSLVVLTLCCAILSNSKYENIAFCLNSKGEVVRKGIARNGKIFKGDVIYNGDKIIVGIDGFLTIRNIHERSEIKIFKNSSIKVSTRKNRTNGEKEFEVAILGGRVIVDKNELNNNKLIINSPSSNVFLKNSHFIINCVDKPLFDQASYCVFTSIEGNIIVENSKSKKLLFLKNGETIISTLKGDFFQIETFRDNENIKNSFKEVLRSF
tara:strand:+ start:894 stop:1538 length:645 start_codon:yes stop_codon:yes gene_type:complete